MGDEDTESCKVVLLGESGVGKTSIITQFMDQEYQENQGATTGATFSTKSMFLKEIDKEIKFEIWDTAGQEKFRALTKMFYKDASVAILVYDITRPKSFEELREYWSVQVQENAPKDILVAVAANKSDMYEEEKVDEATGRQFAKDIKALFKLTSAKDPNCIEGLFHSIGMKHANPEMCINDEGQSEKKPKEGRKGTIKIQKGRKGTGAHNNKDETDDSTNKKKKGCC